MPFTVDVCVVTGSRTWRDRESVWRVLDEYNPSILVCGGCQQGADAHAALWARQREIPQLVMRAKWAVHGKRAGPMRNLAMLKRAVEIADPKNPPYVLAFNAGTRGTTHCVGEARRMRLAVLELEPSDFVGDGGWVEG